MVNVININFTDRSVYVQLLSLEEVREESMQMFFLFLHKNVCYRYSELYLQGTSIEYTLPITFLWRNKKSINSFCKKKKKKASCLNPSPAELGYILLPTDLDLHCLSLSM